MSITPAAHIRHTRFNRNWDHDFAQRFQHSKATSSIKAQQPDLNDIDSGSWPNPGGSIGDPQSRAKDAAINPSFSVTPSKSAQNGNILGVRSVNSPPATRPSGPMPPPSSQTVQTGTGTGQYYVVTNNSSQTSTFAFSADSNAQTGASNNTLATMTLGPGQTGTFVSGPQVSGIRIQASGSDGQTRPNQALYEDTVETNPMGGGDIVHNPDVSDVAGHQGYNGQMQNITVNDGVRTIGNGTTTGAYQFATEDQNPDRATNPMNMALDPSNTYYIVFSG